MTNDSTGVGISLPGVEGMIPYVTERIHATVTSGPCSYDLANPLINENVPIHLYFNRLLKWSPPALKVQVGCFYRGWKTVSVNDDLSIRFVRTVRLPESKKPHKLPMGFGTLPVFELSEMERKSVDQLDALPEHIRDKGGLIMPMYRKYLDTSTQDAPLLTRDRRKRGHVPEFRVRAGHVRHSALPGRSQCHLRQPLRSEHGHHD